MNKSLAILYASQTGNAQDIAETLHRALHSPPSRICPMDDFDLAGLQHECLILFVCSTTGDGEAPENMKKFFRFLMQRNLPPSLMAHLEFAVIGLGDTTYSKFNFTAKKLSRRLISLGAKQLVEPCLANESHPLGTFFYVRKWFPRFCHILRRKFPAYLGDFRLDPTSKPDFPAYEIIWIDSPDHKDDFFTSWGFFPATVVSNDRVTPQTHFQDVRLISLAGISHCREPGDIISILPENPAKIVSNFLNLFQKDKNDYFKLQKCRGTKFTAGSVISAEDLFKHHLDINAVPRRSFFALFLQWASDDLERSRLAEFISDEGLDDLHDYSTRPRRNFYEVMRDFPKTTAKIPFEFLLELIPPLQPRDYSICSAPKEHVEVLYVVVDYKKPGLVDWRVGTCSSWMSCLKEGDGVPVRLKKSGMSFGDHNILVGPGTGVAVFRSHLRGGTARKGDLMFFGCRNRGSDFYFESEWSLCDNLTLFAAFSRDGSQKEYVQHLIEANSEIVWRFLSHLEATVIISGNAKFMPKCVKEAFLNVIVKHGEMSWEEAERFLRRMESSRKYQLHVWT